MAAARRCAGRSRDRIWCRQVRFLACHRVFSVWKESGTNLGLGVGVCVPAPVLHALLLAVVACACAVAVVYNPRKREGTA